MAQHDYIISNATFPAVRADINNALSAIQTNNSGTSRPSGAVAGQIWLDTTNATSPTLKFYDGADDISLATINYTANTVDWLDSSITITGLSTTATGTVLTLSDTATTSSVNLIIDNQKEIRFRETTANGTNYVAFKAPASLASDLTFTLPSTDGASGQALVTNGSGVLSFASSGISWQSVQTSGFTAVAGRGYPCNTTSSAFTVTLPASATAGDTIVLVDYAGTFGTNKLTLSANGLKIEGGTAGKTLTTNREAVTLTYVDSTQGWVSSSASNYGTQSIDPLTYSIDFLVVAGGAGGGGYYSGGGGGAGGYRTSTQTVTAGTTITVTVGDGGNGGGIGENTIATVGSDSSISGSGLTTITSTGGGRGGNGGTAPTQASRNAGSGGSGGGGGGDTSPNFGTAGSGNTPSTSPSQGNNGGAGTGAPNYIGGGGGGAGAVGVAGSSGGNGGNGTASSITGSSVTYAGGGGAGTQGSTAGTGGTGGGGNGTTSGNGSNGTANLGGGGGGGTLVGIGGNGGKGVVILSLPTANYSSTSTGSPTVTTSGSNTILKFTGSGSYTA